MAQIIINIPNAVVNRVVNGLCGQFGYNEYLEDGVTPNPETPAQFAKQVVVQFVKNGVKAWEASQAAEQARLAALQAAEEEIEVN